MKKTHKMDRHLINLRQRWELRYVIEKMAAEGIRITAFGIVDAARQLKTRSRRKIYNFLRNKK